ncbi:cupin domain-containing protein [Vibrio quintilis]|uniref:ChrR Cupin-like domain protein n=1 Tax=Vibrio quintilis TaxID=1117707 RepID=A0A1M7Z1L9_9VIBR|nr:cupin domain-containing protein [Vibrio quintilis]SHO58702.1 ChrR Cupin-like domain protein [Vibrio quintilis]
MQIDREQSGNREQTENGNQQRIWQDTPYPGVCFYGLSESLESGRTALLKFDAGARLPAHAHPGWEQLLILEGQFRVNHQCCHPRDYVFLPAGETHEVEAITAGIYLTIAEKAGVKISKEAEI